MRDKKKYSVGSSWLNQIKKNRCLLLMLFPVLLYFIVFCYIPMFGNIMAFEDYSVGKGFLHSEWVGFRWFREFTLGDHIREIDKAGFQTFADNIRIALISHHTLGCYSFRNATTFGTAVFKLFFAVAEGWRFSSTKYCPRALS